MKTIIITLLLVFSILQPISSQNRISTWESDKISSIQVETLKPVRAKRIQVFQSRNDMDAILSFLRSVEFRSVNSTNIDSLDEDPESKIKLTFNGQRDQVYLYDHSASIGKTSFLIHQGIIQKFEAMLAQLDKYEKQ